jgi:uroporphyrinogen decarboxylase
MNSRERLLKTLKHEPVDRMPIAPFLYYNAIYEMFDHKPDLEHFFDPFDFDPIEKFVEYCDHFGFDVLHVLGSVWDMYAAYSSINDHSVVRPWENWDVTIESSRKGGESIQRTVKIKTPDGELRHIEKLERSSTYLVVAAPIEYLIKTKEDFDIFRKYSPPCDFMDTRLVTRAREATGEKGLVDTCTQGAFNLTAQFRKLENLMMDPVTDEGFYREMIDYFTNNQIKRNKKLVEAGADLIEIGANLATSAVGPEFFKKYVLEYENRILKAIHEEGVPNIYHNCGDADKIMHLYNDMEMDCWGYITPPPFGDVELDKVLEVIRPSIALRGNIDQVEFLMKASPEEVKERVKDVVLKAKQRGNFILSTTDFFFDGTPYDNIKAFAKAGMEYGQY